VEAIKLANRIEALKMQEDEGDDAPGQADVPANAKAAASEVIAGHDGRSGLSTSTEAGSAPGGKKSLSKIARGAIFREVVLAKVRAIKEEERQKEALEAAARNA